MQEATVFSTVARTNATDIQFWKQNRCLRTGIGLISLNHLMALGRQGPRTKRSSSIKTLKAMEYDLLVQGQRGKKKNTMGRSPDWQTSTSLEEVQAVQNQLAMRFYAELQWLKRPSWWFSMARNFLADVGNLPAYRAGKCCLMTSLWFGIRCIVSPWNVC
jgi:hypothetical protein